MVILGYSGMEIAEPRVQKVTVPVTYWHKGGAGMFWYKQDFWQRASQPESQLALAPGAVLHAMTSPKLGMTEKDTPSA